MITWDEQDVQRGAVVEAELCHHSHALAALDDAGLLGPVSSLKAPSLPCTSGGATRMSLCYSTGHQHG